jgi:hypothetical protein
MSETFKISCTIQPEGDPMGIEIWVHDTKLFDRPSMVLPEDFEYTCADIEHENCSIRFVLKNKTTAHTKIDSDSNIVSDSTVAISNICFDEINVDQIFYDHAQYLHDYNGTGAEITEQFYGIMGCNGTVKLGFTTPIYLWLLENM